MPGGWGMLFYGADGTDALGCGLFAAGYGELLLSFAPTPHQAGFAPLVTGTMADKSVFQGR